jgi:Domain of unknown function (DUF4390)
LVARTGWLRCLGQWVVGLCAVALWGLLGGAAMAADNSTAEITSLRVERTEDGVFLSAQLNIELPSVVEDALFKGVPISFVSEADVYRDRWYWYDKRVATATRSVRLAFQPLTRRWRISVSSGTIASPATGIALSQHFDNLSDAFGAVRRIARWKIAEAQDVSADSRHNIDYRFKLDLSQLPRPLQIGVLGKNEWNISVERNVRPEFTIELRDSR